MPLPRNVPYKPGDPMPCDATRLRAALAVDEPGIRFAESWLDIARVVEPCSCAKCRATVSWIDQLTAGCSCNACAEYRRGRTSGA